MRNKICILAVFAFIVCLPNSARADKEFIQKLQNILATVEEKAKLAQEKIQEIKDKAKSLAEGAQGMAADIKSGIDAARNMDLDTLKDMATRVEGLPIGKDVEKDEMAGAIEENYVPKVGAGNDLEADKAAKEFIQEVLRNAVAKLYALGFTNRTALQKEKPRDVDMTDSRQIFQETNSKINEVIDRLSQIYMLEAAMEEYQYTQSLKNLQNNVSEQEGEK